MDEVADEADRVEEQLARYSRLVNAAIEALLASGEPADYLSDLLRAYPRRAGKGIRPALLMAACQAFGGSLTDALRPAVALEMLHNAFLIHDDLEDGSTVRRGAPTLHVAHGLPLALNAGDALAALAMEPLLDEDAIGARLARKLVEEFLTAVRVTTEGQALELGWRRHNVVHLRPADYLGMVAKKTCWYTTVCPLRLGALVAQRRLAPLAALSRFGLYLGTVFQIRDDLLSTSETVSSNGKDTLGDLIEGKRTLMLIHLLREVEGTDRRWLVGYLATPAASRSTSDAANVLELMEDYGSLVFARHYAEEMAAAALEVFSAAFAEAEHAPAAQFVRALIPYMLGRAT